MGNFVSYSSAQDANGWKDVPRHLYLKDEDVEETPSLLKDLEEEKKYATKVTESIKNYVLEMKLPYHEYDENGRMLITLFTLSTKEDENGSYKDRMKHWIFATSIDLEDIKPHSYIHLFHYIEDVVQRIHIPVDSESYYRGFSMRLTRVKNGDLFVYKCVIMNPGSRRPNSSISPYSI
mgnify:FL=1